MIPASQRFGLRVDGGHGSCRSNGTRTGRDPAASECQVENTVTQPFLTGAAWKDEAPRGATEKPRAARPSSWSHEALTV